jgi:hypothetical protein
MRRFTAIALLSAVWMQGSPLDAQTVRPAVVEYKAAGKGKFDLVNESLFPMTVVLEPRGFRVEESGDLVDQPFDSTNVELKLSAMSFKIPPLSSYTVFYEAKAKTLPAWFMVLSAMTGARTSNGLNLRIELPHVVYLLQKQALQKEAVTVTSFVYDTAGKKAVLEIENNSMSLGRVMASELTARGKHATPFGGFPLFPMSRRRVEVPWESGDAPDKVMLRFSQFALEEQRISTQK